MRFPVGVVADGGAQQAWQGQVVEEKLHELFLAKREGEVVFAFAGVGGLRAAARARRGARDEVAPQVVSIAGMNRVTHTARAMM